MASSSYRSAISSSARSSSARNSDRALRLRAMVKAIAAREMECSRPDLMWFNQPLGNGVERREGIGGLHEIGLWHRGLPDHNICVEGKLGSSEGWTIIGGPIQRTHISMQSRSSVRGST
jgi:hypothetical protein